MKTKMLADFQICISVPLNRNPVKEILKIRCHVHILMKKVIIMGKMHVIINSFAPPFISHFSLNLNRKKSCGNETHKKETKYIQVSVADLLHIRKGNLDCYKCQKQLPGCILQKMCS